jgi:exodeoxyribonuclease-3
MRFLTGFARQVDASVGGRSPPGATTSHGRLQHRPRPLDVVNWKRQHRSEGFLPRARLARHLIRPRRLHDVVRRLHPDTQGPYSWWSWLGESFTKDTGWRIDLHLATRAWRAPPSPAAPTVTRLVTLA